MRDEQRPGRSGDPVTVARAGLADPHISAVYLVGPPGSGKSFLLNQLTHADDLAGPNPARTRVSSRRVRPLAVRAGGIDDAGISALLALLASVASAGDDDHSGTAIPEPRSPAFVAIDDIDRLDPAVLTTLGQAVDGQRFRLLATVRTDAAAEVLCRLRILGGSSVVTLPPWRRKDVADLLEQRLGGPVHGLTVASLTRLSGGNPLCVRELLDLGIATGALRCAYGVRLWDGDFTVPPVTAARVADGLPNLFPAAQDVLDTISFAGTVPLDLIASSCSYEAVEQADDASVLQVRSRGGRLVVSARSAIESRVIAAGLSRTRRRRLGQALLVALEQIEETERAAILEIAELNWLTEVEPSDGLAVAAADAARARHRPALAEQLSRPQQPTRGARASTRMADALIRGQVIEALAALEAQGGRPCPDDEASALVLAGVAHLVCGRLAEARRHARRLLHRGEAEDWPTAYQLGSLLAGRCAMAAGDVHDARLRFAEAAMCPAAPDMLALVPTALTHLALALAAMGRLDESQATLASAADQDVPRLAGLADINDVTAAEILLESGLHRSAWEAALPVADRCERAGHALPAMLALHVCARSRPTSEAATRLGVLSGCTDLGLAPAFHRLALGAARRDPAGVAAAAEQLDRLGLHRLAAEAAATALSLTSPPRTAPWVSRCRRMLDRLRTAADAAVPAWWWQSDEQITVLTEREREIAELVASGWSSPQIASHLQLSRRTVENHLQHSYRKLGVSRRQELATALGYPRQVQSRQVGATSAPRLPAAGGGSD